METIPKNSTKIISWNVNGIRSHIINDKTPANKKPIIIDHDSNFYQMAQQYDPDIICLQETRCSQEVFDRIYEPGDPIYPFRYINPSTGTDRGRGSGYSGTAVFSKFKPNDVIFGLPTLTEENNEGRVITIEYERFYLINVYTPNSGTNEEYRTTIWDIAMLSWINKLKEKKSVILVGDMNVCHQDIDIYSGIPKNLKERIAGLLPEERDGFGKYIENGMIDSYRKFNDSDGGYTWWNPKIKAFRSANKGWRIDYGLVSDDIEDGIIGSEILSKIMGSDHCPIMLSIKN